MFSFLPVRLAEFVRDAVSRLEVSDVGLARREGIDGDQQHGLSAQEAVEEAERGTGIESGRRLRLRFRGRLFLLHRVHRRISCRRRRGSGRRCSGWLACDQRVQRSRIEPVAVADEGRAQPRRLQRRAPWLDPLGRCGDEQEPMRRSDGGDAVLDGRHRRPVGYESPGLTGQERVEREVPEGGRAKPMPVIAPHDQGCLRLGYGIAGAMPTDDEQGDLAFARGLEEGAQPVRAEEFLLGRALPVCVLPWRRGAVHHGRLHPAVKRSSSSPRSCAGNEAASSMATTKACACS